MLISTVGPSRDPGKNATADTPRNAASAGKQSKPSSAAKLGHGWDEVIARVNAENGF